MATQTALTEADYEFRPCSIADLMYGIGQMTLLGVSGGRHEILSNDHGQYGVRLPVGQGYAVEVLYHWSDTFTVRRVFKRGGNYYLKGVREEVYVFDLSETVWEASCYVNVTFGEDVR